MGGWSWMCTILCSVGRCFRVRLVAPRVLRSPKKTPKKKGEFSGNNHNRQRPCCLETAYRIMSKPENIGNDAANPSRLSSRGGR